MNSVDKPARYDAAWLKSNVKGLPSSLPDDVIQVAIKSKYALDENPQLERVNLGLLKTGKWYFALIKYINTLDVPVKISDMTSNCGCLAAGDLQQVIQPGKEGMVVAIISPQLQTAKYGKTMTKTFDNGIEWTFLITAEIRSEYVLPIDKLKIADRENAIQLKFERGFPEDASEHRDSELKVQSMTGALRIESQSTGQDGSILVNCRVPVHTFESTLPIVERLSIMTVPDRTVICESAISLEFPNRISIKPRRVALKRSRDGVYSGMAFLVGDISKFDLSAGAELQLLRAEGGLVGDCQIKPVKTAVSRVQFEVRVSDVFDRKEVLSAKIVSGESVICVVPEITFFEEE